jgi:WD40 repeat protein
MNTAKISLQRLDLSYVKITKANLCNADLYRTNFSHSDVSFVNFSNCNLNKVDFRGANMIEPFFNIYPCIEGHTGYVFSLDCSKMTNIIYTAGEDKTIKIWNRDTGE